MVSSNRVHAAETGNKEMRAAAAKAMLFSNAGREMTECVNGAL